MSFELVTRLLCQGESEALQRTLWGLLSPQPASYWEDKFDWPDVVPAGIPVGYIVPADDLVFGQRGPRDAARLGVAPITVPGTHEALLTHPAEVADALLRGAA